MKVKVYIKARKSEVIDIDAKNSFDLQTKLNLKYGLCGWLGFEILKR